MAYVLHTFGVIWYTGGAASGEPVSSLPGAYYGSGTTVPVAFSPLTPSSSWYSVDGVLLDSQPQVCTAPTIQGNIIPQGSTFILEFVSPSVLAQGLLTDRTTVSLTFLLYGGKSVTGTVSLSSTLVGSVFQVVCTTTAAISL